VPVVEPLPGVAGGDDDDDEEDEEESVVEDDDDSASAAEDEAADEFGSESSTIEDEETAYLAAREFCNSHCQRRQWRTAPRRSRPCRRRRDRQQHCSRQVKCRSTSNHRHWICKSNDTAN
jgi:hypothetical protein